MQWDLIPELMNPATTRDRSADVVFARGCWILSSTWTFSRWSRLRDIIEYHYRSMLIIVAVESTAVFFQEQLGGSCADVKPITLLRDSDFLSIALGWSSDVRGLGVSLLVVSRFVQKSEARD